MTDPRRRYERIELELPCRLFIEDSKRDDLLFESFCRTGNLCLGGVFVMSDLLMRVGVQLTVELQLPDGPLPIFGRIVHRVEHDNGTQPTRMGIEFQDVDAHGRETLLRYFTPDRYSQFYAAMTTEFPHLEKQIEIPEVSLVLNLWEEWKVRQDGGPASTAAGAPPPPTRRR